MRLRTPRAALASGALLLVGAADVATGCDHSYAAPCRVSSRRVIAGEAAPVATEISLTRSRAGVIASWPIAVEGPSLDETSGRLLPVTAFDVVQLDESGALSARSRVPAPEALRSRRGGVGDDGVVVEDGAFLVHWVETTTASEGDGRVRTSAAMKAGYVVAGTPLPVIAPPRAACERCSLRIAVVSLGAESLAFYRIDPQPDEPVLGASVTPVLGAVRIRRDGTIIDEIAPWLALPPSSADGDVGGVASTSARRGDLFAGMGGSGGIDVVSGGRAWRTEASLARADGPVLLPRPSARVVWAPSGESSVVWTVSPSEDGRSADTGEDTDLFLGRVPPGSAGVATRERISWGARLLAADRRDDDVGMLFESGGRTLFAAADPHGRKRGGDLFVRSLARTGEQTSSGAAVAISPDPHVLLAHGEGRFIAIAAGIGGLTSTEIRCGE